jgi:molecular chaperone DnaK (HSP70)
LNEKVFSLKMKEISLKEVMKIFISKIKKQSEFYTGKDEIKECILSIPDDLKEYQMNFIKSCFQEVELNILSFLKCSTCISLSYGLDKYNKTTSEKKKIALLVDNGSDTLKLSLVEVSHGGLFKIISSKSFKTSHVSGNDFDEIIFNFCLKEFSKKNKVNEDDFKDNKKSVEKLKLECEK